MLEIGDVIHDSEYHVNIVFVCTTVSQSEIDEVKGKDEMLCALKSQQWIVGNVSCICYWLSDTLTKKDIVAKLLAGEELDCRHLKVDELRKKEKRFSIKNELKVYLLKKNFYSKVNGVKTYLDYFDDNTLYSIAKPIYSEYIRKHRKLVKLKEGKVIHDKTGKEYVYCGLSLSPHNDDAFVVYITENVKEKRPFYIGIEEFEKGYTVKRGAELVELPYSYSYTMIAFERYRW